MSLEGQMIGTSVLERVFQSDLSAPAAVVRARILEYIVGILQELILTLVVGDGRHKLADV